MKEYGAFFDVVGKKTAQRAGCDGIIYMFLMSHIYHAFTTMYVLNIITKVTK